jgi:GTPase SAR1 family protein
MSSLDIRNWHANVGQHASEGVNKILIGNKSDWTDKRAVTEDQGRDLAAELDMKFMETSAKANEGVEEAFFALARFVPPPYACDFKLNCQCTGTVRLGSSTHKQTQLPHRAVHPTQTGQ